MRNNDKMMKRNVFVKRYLRDRDWLDTTNEGKGEAQVAHVATRWMVVSFTETECPQ